MAEEAGGSPQLMQTLCLNACLEAEIASRPSIHMHLPSDDSFLKKVCAINVRYDGFRVCYAPARVIYPDGDAHPIVSIAAGTRHSLALETLLVFS